MNNQKYILINQKKFYFTPLFEFHNRKFSIAYTTIPHETTQNIVPRVFYQSRSDGTWRACPWAKDTWYAKGKGIHYTQETKLHFEILKFLESQKNNIQESHCDIIHTFFQKEDSEVQQYNSEVQKYDDQGFLASFQSHKAGNSFSENFSPQDYLDTIPWEHENWKTFFPDFNTPPKSTYFLTHSLLGDITIETFPASLQKKEIEWAIASDTNNRVWIDRIQFSGKNLSITSYGTSSQIIDSGFLTTKPLEYTHQCRHMRQGIDYTPFNNTYNDLSPLLDQFPLLKKYKNRTTLKKKSS